MSVPKVLEQLKTTFKNLSTAKLITLLVLTACTITGFAWLLVWSGRPDYQPLYSNLTVDDATAIVAEIKEMKIPYRVGNAGTSIEVPQKDLYEARMALASKGLPLGGGVGFEVFDDTKLGMTEFAQNVNYQRAMQGELARTINQFAEVESSRVHIVMSKKSLFVEEDEPATASVVLKLKAGKKLRKKQVQGIVHLVSSAISGLSPEKVTIVDNYGRMLAGFEDGGSMGAISADQLKIQDTMERKMETRIRSMLEEALGPGKAIVRVNLDLDMVQHEKTEEMYLPENQVIRSEQVLSATMDGKGQTASGIPGTTTGMNPEQTGGTAGAGANQNILKQDRTTNYEIGRVTSHKIMPVGSISHISAAVLIDGTYKKVTGNEGETIWKYFPRRAEEMAKLDNLVRRAVNYNENRGDKIEVANIPFETARLSDDLEKGGGWVDSLEGYKPLIRYGVSALFILLAFFFVIRPLVRWLTGGGSEIEMLKQLPKTVGEIESEMSGGLPFRQQALQLIMDEGEASAQAMKEWAQK
jgi:flagellar M-ring protein FliF